MVDNLKKLGPINKACQDIDPSGSKVIELAHRIDEFGLPPLDISWIVAMGCFLECNVKLFQLTALALYNQVNNGPSYLDWSTTVR